MYELSNIHWFNFSVFYGRNHWSELLKKSYLFYSQNSNILKNGLFFLSEERGEHIQILFSIENSEIEKVNSIHKKIEKAFEEFTNDYPSSSCKPFPYGQSIWHYYNNNSIVWDRFNVRDFGEYYIDFAQKTSSLIVSLLKDDTSGDNVFSTCLYLCTKLTRLLKKKEIESTITICSDYMIKHSDSYESYYLVSNYITVDPKNLVHIVQAIAEYYQEDSMEENNYFDEWYNEAKKLYLQRGGSMYVYHTLCSVTCEHLGLRASHQLLLYKFIAEWSSV